MTLLIGIISVAAVSVVLVFCAGSLLDFFSSDSRELRARKKANTKALVTRTKQLGTARAALMRIAVEDSGNPALDARLALDEIQNLELLELEK